MASASTPAIPPPTANSTSQRQSLPTVSPSVDPPPRARLPTTPSPSLPPAPEIPQGRPPRRPGASTGGPLRRGLTAPAFSTVSTNTETATAAPLNASPQEAKEKFRARALSASVERAVGLGLSATVEELREAEEQVPRLPTAQNGLRQSYEGALRQQASRGSLNRKEIRVASIEATLENQTTEGSRSDKTSERGFDNMTKASPEISTPSKTPDSGKSDKVRHDGSVDTSKPRAQPPPSKNASTISRSSSKADEKKPDASPATSASDSPPRRRLWDWARVGVSVPTLGIVSRRSYGDLRSSTDVRVAPTSQPAAENAPVTPVPESQDDFSVPSAVSTGDGLSDDASAIAAMWAESIGLANSTVPLPSLSPLVEFAETKSSSDDIAAETNGH